MKVEVEKQDKLTAKINLEIPPEQASQEYNKAWRRLGQRLNIPGFRRGKAPRGMVEKTVGIERIKQEALDRLLPHVFADAISEHQLDIVAPPQIESFKFELNDGIRILASVELRPEAKLPELANIKVDVPEYKNPDDAEAKELQTIVERLSSLEPVIDRPTQKDDIVSIDFTGYANGELIRGGAAKNYKLDLSNNNFIEGFAEQLIGHKLSEEFSINVSFPENYHDAALAGKPAEFKIKINEISQKVTPELNDELAKKVGPYENLEALKEDVRTMLKESVDQENNYRKQKAVVDYLVDNAEVEIPEPMVARETRLLVEDIKQRVKSQGLSWEKFLESQGADATMSNLREEATKRIKTSLVFGTLAKQEGIRVEENEFSEQVRELAAMRGVDEKNIMRHLGNNFEAAQALSDQLLSQKIVEFLTARAEFNFVPEPPEGTEVKRPDQKSAKGDDKAEGSKPENAVAEAIEGEKFDIVEAEA
ncbi:MAG: trigger factor [Vampirovibrionales bacterium]|nr:trigger factor [Vampirovibrionales bacterium]